MSRDGYMTILLGILSSAPIGNFSQIRSAVPIHGTGTMQTGPDDAGRVIAGPGPRRALG